MSPNGLPSDPTIPITPFKIDIPKQDVNELKSLLKLSRLTRKSYENTQKEMSFGIRYDSVERMRKSWMNDFEWYKQQSRLNEIPQYMATLKNKDGREYSIHFAALFSKNQDAVPVIFSHGWPGCWVEFMPMMEMMKKKYPDGDYPIHVIVPSLPGYLFSSTPPTDKEFSLKDVAYLWNQLMIGLGFDKYIAQGGDVGSYLTFQIARDYEQCEAIHVNFLNIPAPPEGTPEHSKMGAPPPPDRIIQGLNGLAYALQQATRPSTIGIAIASNPIALLAWVGEKYLEISGLTPDDEMILTFLSLYWFTDCFGTGIWFYRYMLGPLANPAEQSDPVLMGGYLEKPFGYSKYPKEVSKPPLHWVEKLGNLVWSKEHQDKGGHFSALECPEQMWDDITDFVSKNWTDKRSKL